MLTNQAGAEFFVIADVQVRSTSGTSATCNLTIDSTTIDSDTVNVPASGFTQVVLQGDNTATTGTISMACTGSNVEFTQYHIQALQVNAP